MKLAIDRLGTAPSEHRFEPASGWWAEWAGTQAQPGCRLVGPPVFVVVARVRGDDVSLDGELHVDLDLECSRCLKRYGHALSDTFHLILEPIGDRSPTDPETAEHLARHGMCLSDELEVGWYRGKEVSLEPYLAEVVALALPVQSVCRESCAGLCPHCGIDRNETSCDCTDIVLKPKSPFAVLAALRKGSDGSS
jgi:uncharacterized metal-binding protein YceD (DUF177 family)